MASPMTTGPSVLEDDREEEESFLYATQVTTSVVLPMGMQTAIELGVFEILAKAGPGAELSPSQIAEQMPTKNPEAPVMLGRILMLLATHALLGCSVVFDDSGSFRRLYSLSRVSKDFVPNQDGFSLDPFMALVQDKVFLDSWLHLKDAILEGGVPFNKFHGMKSSEYRSIDLRFNQVFKKSIFNQTPIFMKKILEFYKGFQEIKKLVDVSGNLGVTLNLITSKYPHIKDINYDLPEVV